MTNADTRPSVLDWTLGDRLGKALRISGIGNQEMADYLGVSRNTVGNYIADRTPITEGYVKLWALKTGVGYKELRTGMPSGNDDGPDGGIPSELAEKITFGLLASRGNVRALFPQAREAEIEDDQAA